MKIREVLLCISFYILHSEQSKSYDNHYWAGVVEFSSKEAWSNPAASHNNTMSNLEKYKEIIGSPDAYPVDIMVFPEGTLNSIHTASFVPNPEDNIFACNDPEYEPVVRELSCHARSHQKYLVVNLIEKAPCPEPDDQRPCAKGGLYRFNTNVIFDRRGVVIARYRKFNLFSEPGINTTVKPEIVKFHTDFGVTFGTFICFDLMFEKPALKLVQSGVTDIIFPTMWFSELPFLTAVQIQQGWAYENNVNLLAAGASYPQVGSTGTGVYAGRRGRIVSIMSHTADIQLFVGKVPKIDATDEVVMRQPVNKNTPEEMTSLNLKRDQIDGYETSSLPLTSNDEYTKKLCQKDLCCEFTLNYTVILPTDPDAQYYSYRLAVHDGNRTFDGHADGIITTCSVLACTGERLATCGIRFSNSSPVKNAVQFNSIAISGDFPGGKDVFLVPSNLDTSILPLEVTEFDYRHRLSDSHNYVQYNLTNPRSDLLTFAIWGRKFVQSDAGARWANGMDEQHSEL
ncbi:vanin-like protein 1 isoform X2 [Toxorhynchites rutilus septentrionalis]|uniref:vanin-like protein 1 isoform X2 n=1 Tax=Toxorhynchites rutilus septentrionalis TaxID=329112 RepID=UPI002478898A|nr:vanin-like protein 1 isoform X2 [Toxorhynchites rutilus septentrionalis]